MLYVASFLKFIAAITPPKWLLIVITGQFLLFILFLVYLFQIRSRFRFIVKKGVSLSSFFNVSQNSSSLSSSEQEFFSFIAPYRSSRLSEQVKRSDIFDRVLARALQNEEVARSFMNGIIVLGLFGTVTIIASRIFFNFDGDVMSLLTEGPDVGLGKKMLNFLPFAFVPSAIGLFLALIASIFLSLRLKIAYREADSITDKIMIELPKHESVEEVIKGVFSAELQRFLKCLPEQIKTAFTDIRVEMQHFLENLVSPYAESMKQATDQIPEMGRIVKDFGSQLSMFSEKLNALVQHTKESQTTLSGLSGEVAEASKELKKSVKSAHELFKQFEVRYRDFSGLYQSTILKTTEEFEKVFQRMEKNHMSMILSIEQKANSNYVNWLNKLNEIELKREEKMKEKYLEMTKELIDQINLQTQNLFIKHKEALDSLTETLRLIGENFKGYIEYVKRFNQELQVGTTKASELSVAFQEMVTKANTISGSLQRFGDIERAINDLRQLTKVTQEHIKKTEDQARVLIRQVYERLDRVCNLMDTTNQRR